MVTVTDPQALENAARRFPELHYEANSDVAIAKSDALLLLTEWREYRNLDPYEVAAHSSVTPYSGRPQRPRRRQMAGCWLDFTAALDDRKK